MLVKYEQNHMVRTIQNFDLFDKKWLRANPGIGGHFRKLKI